MLTFYYNRLSINARRVWVLLLEKQIPFEAVLMPLNGEQLQADFLQLNPFHHIPVLAEADGSVVIESLAILDYLEATFPTPAFLPTDPKSIATVRMAQQVTVNEFAPATFPLMLKEFGLEDESPKLEQSRQKIATALQFFEQQLSHAQPFYTGESLTLADIVVGTALPLLYRLNYSLQGYSSVQRWLERLMQRESWQRTEPTTEEVAAFQVKLQKRFRSN